MCSVSAYGTARETHCGATAHVLHVAFQRNPVLMVQFWAAVNCPHLTRRELEALHEWVLRERRALRRSTGAAGSDGAVFAVLRQHNAVPALISAAVQLFETRDTPVTAQDHNLVPPLGVFDDAAEYALQPR